VALLSIAATGILAGNAQCGDLSGDVFVVTRAGDVKRGASVGISLIPATAEFDKGRARLVEEQRTAEASVRAAYEREQSEDRARREESKNHIEESKKRVAADRQRAERAVSAARKEREAAYRAFTETASRLVSKGADETNSPELAAANRRNRESVTALERAERDQQATSERSSREQRKLEVAERELQAGFRGPAVIDRASGALSFAQLTKTHRVKELVTDINGHYEEKGLRNGRYYLYATHHILDSPLCWFVETEVKGGANKVDLTGRNMGCPFEK
jgi:hypothetical protein